MTKHLKVRGCRLTDVIAASPGYFVQPGNLEFPQTGKEVSTARFTSPSIDTQPRVGTQGSNGSQIRVRSSLGVRLLKALDRIL
jgi:hypothetical protein